MKYKKFKFVYDLIYFWGLFTRPGEVFITMPVPKFFDSGVFEGRKIETVKNKRKILFIKHRLREVWAFDAAGKVARVEKDIPSYKLEMHPKNK